MIRLIDIEIILARTREGRQEQANRRRRRRRQVWTREWLNRRVFVALFVFSLGESSMVGILLGTFFFFGGIMQQVLCCFKVSAGSCVFCCVRVLYDHTRALYRCRDRVWSYLTMYNSYLNRIGRMAIVWNCIGRIKPCVHSCESYGCIYGLVRSHTVLYDR